MAEPTEPAARMAEPTDPAARMAEPTEPTAQLPVQGPGPMITARPSCLTAAWPQHSASQLHSFYQRDIAALGPFAVPAHPGTPSAIRLVTWNVNYLSYAEASSPAAVWEALRSMQGDVLVLQEFSAYPVSSGTGVGEVMDPEWAGGGVKPSALAQLLREGGYSLHPTANYYPTMLATRLALCDPPPASIQLSSDRAAMLASVLLPGTQQRLTVLGTHLDHLHAPQRLAEAQQLRAAMEGSSPVLLAADFNQPRSRDHSAEEWGWVAGKRAARGEAESDGVDELLQGMGLAACFDSTQPAQRNWPEGGLSPSTHWTGLCVDRAYARGMQCSRVWVCPSALSDHAAVVTDWVLE